MFEEGVELEEEVAVDEEEEEEKQVEEEQVEERRRSMNMRNKGTGTVSKTEEIWVELTNFLSEQQMMCFLRMVEQNIHL